MEEISLMQLMEDHPIEDGALRHYAKVGCVSGMVERLNAGACVLSTGNDLHDQPEILLALLDATLLVAPELGQRARAILAVMCRKLRGPQRQILDGWLAEHADALAGATGATGVTGSMDDAPVATQ